MSDSCTVTIDGSASGTYFIPCDMVEYFADGLINTSNTTVNLYDSYRHYNSSSNYGYIVCRSYTYPYIYNSYNSYTELTDITSMSFNKSSNFYLQKGYIQLFVYFLLCLACFCVVFRKVH